MRVTVYMLVFCISFDSVNFSISVLRVFSVKFLVYCLDFLYCLYPPEVIGWWFQHACGRVYKKECMYKEHITLEGFTLAYSSDLAWKQNTASHD